MTVMMKSEWEAWSDLNERDGEEEMSDLSCVFGSTSNENVGREGEAGVRRQRYRF